LSFPLPPAPITWTAGQNITVPELRADPANLAWLLTKRPLLVASQLTTGQAIAESTIVPVELDTETADNWNGHAIPAATYAPPFAGWYLAEGTAFVTGTAQTGIVAAGIQAVQNSVTSSYYGGRSVPNGVQATAPVCASLVQLNPFTDDTVALFAYQSLAASQDLLTNPGAFFTVQWVALPYNITEGEGWVNGTVVGDPQPAALWAPGSGTLITNSGGIAAGATSMTVGETTGMIVGGTLGLDYYQGTAVSPMAEAVTITSITGTTIGISATSYPHGGTLTPGYVAIPVSAAFMNSQVRDVINFLAFPPICELSNFGGTQTVESQTFPAGTAVTFVSDMIDNFHAWNSGENYVFPVAGLYYIYGHVLLNSAITSLSAGISINGGTIQWGASVRTSGGTAENLCATVRREIRVDADDFVTLYCSQNSGSTLGLANAATSHSTLIVVWRGF
jgi:hypothetical protein